LNDCLQISDSSQVDYDCLDRRERQIRRHMLGGMAVGLLLSAAGSVITTPGNGALSALITSIFLIVMLTAGRLSLGFGWALVNTGLTAAGLLTGHVFTATFRGESPLDFPGAGLGVDGLLLLLVLTGALAHVARRESIWGDVAAGLLALVMAAGALHGGWNGSGILPGPGWAWAAALVFGLICAVPLRSPWARRIWVGAAGAVAAICSPARPI
jgi:hypothetical protein